MPSASKTKGNTNERDTAKLLTEWYGKEFKRTPNSGALRWSGVSWVYGDLLPPEGLNVVIECKFYKSVDLDEIIRCKPNDGNILGWWNEVLTDSKRCLEETGTYVEPLLIFKANRKPRRIVIQKVFLESLMTPPQSYFSVTLPDFGNLIIVDLQLFLETVSPQTFQQALRLTEMCGFQ